MSLNVRNLIAGLARSLGRSRRPAARPSFRPALLCLEDRMLRSTLTVLNLHDHGAGSLRAALAQAGDGDTVVFARGLRGTINLTSGELQVGPGVTVRGPGADRLSVSANHTARVFEILAGDEVKLSGLTITGGVASAPGPGVPSGKGGSICVDQGACLTLTDSAVTGNTANAASVLGSLSADLLGCGGGIYNAGTLTLEGDTVANNVANSGFAAAGEASVRGFGGGVYNAGTLAVRHSALSGNVANSGQALSSVPVTADARGFGGGIYNAGALTLSDTTLNGNTANAGASGFFVAGFGGGIYSEGSGVSLLRVMLAGDTANSATVTAGGEADVAGYGGGVDMESGTLTVKESTFTGDVANAGSAIATDALSGAYVMGGGGAIATGNLAAGPVTIADSVFMGNVGNTGAGSASFQVEVKGRGGAIYTPSIYSTLTVSRSVFRENTANAGPVTSPGGSAQIDSAGGAIENDGALTISRGIFTGNVGNSADASGEIHAAGGAIEDDAGGGFLDVGPVSIAGSTLANNTANAGSSPGAIYAYGGAIDNPSSSTALSLTGSTLVNNTANSGSGATALYAGGGGLAVVDATVQNTLVAGNVVNSGSGVGAVYLSGGGLVVGGTATLQGTLVLDNNVNTDPGSGQAAADSYAGGGGIAVEGGALLTLNFSTVTDNLSLDTPSDIALLGTGQVNAASVHNLIGEGGSGGLTNGAGGNLVL
jgi:hypothetical protein